MNTMVVLIGMELMGLVFIWVLFHFVSHAVAAFDSPLTAAVIRRK